MRRVLHLDKAIGSLRPRSNIFSSRGQQAPLSTSSRRAARPGSIPYTEKVRRKMWGTDHPPGQEDPYSELSAIEKPRLEKSVRDEAEEDVQLKRSPSLTPTYNTELEMYKPASTWDGLDVIGGLEEKEFHFEGFLPEKKLENKYKATTALNQAIVEVFTLKQADKPLSILRDSGKRNLTGEVKIRVSTSTASGVVLDFPKSGLKSQLLEYLMLVDRPLSDPNAVVSEDDVENGAWKDILPNTTTEDLLPEGKVYQSQNFSYHPQVASWDPVWLRISLDDPEVKFAIIKRVMQLTGIRIPDPAINTISNVKTLLLQLAKPPKPKKLAEALVRKGDLVGLPNVKIFNRRLTPIDREQSIGRWKIIVKALEARGLPVTGH